LKTQIGKNVKAYVDDVVVKTTEEDKLIADLTETIANLREFQWKLNPTKCVFGVPSGLLLGFMVGHQGICHTRFSEGNQVQTYMHARIKFHAYSDI
jgi:hypothetical protein